MSWTTRSSPALDYRNLEMRKYDRRCRALSVLSILSPGGGIAAGCRSLAVEALSCPIGRDPGTDVRFAGVIGQPPLSGASLFGAFKPAVSAASNGLPRLPQVAEAVAQRIAAVGGAGSALGGSSEAGLSDFGVWLCEGGFQAAWVARWWRWALVRLWAIISNRNSVRTFILPRR